MRSYSQKERLSKALSRLGKPSFVNQRVKSLPCDLCNRYHTRVIAIYVEECLAWEIHSPCLDSLAKLAVERIG